MPLIPPSDPSWLAAIGSEFSKPYMRGLDTMLVSEALAGFTVWPPADKIFAALEQTPLSSVRVVILGQDPYFNPGQAHGLSFSVSRGGKIPPTLPNIFTELSADVGVTSPDHGCLEEWAAQGVLLLNTILTVRNKALTHKGRGWETFTDQVIQAVNEGENRVAFILWGNHSRKKAKLINANRHLIIESSHPSPLGVRHSFRGSKPFSRANAFLISTGSLPVDWRLT